MASRTTIHRWGAGVVEQISMDLQAAFPESQGFSLSNLWRMKQWYLFYAESSEKLARLGRELTTSGKLAQVVQELQLSESHSFEKLAQPVREFPVILGLVPWGHHIDIIAHCKSLEEAFFYLSKTITDGLSRKAHKKSLNL